MSVRENFVVYSKPGCINCSKAKAYLERKGFDYYEKVIGEDLTREEFMELYPGVRSLPHIFRNERLIGGYDKLVEELQNEEGESQVLN